MAHTKHRKHTTRPPRRTARTGRHTLRREAPTTVAVVTDPADFAAMRGYRSFTFDDHPTYLRQIEGLLRSLTARGIHVRVGPFDPAEYAEYCADTGHDPDSSRSRTRYAADVTTAGPTVPYTGQPLELLVSEVACEAGRQATWERASGILAGAGDRTGYGDDLARTSFDRASEALMRLLEAAGEGHHHLVCSVPSEDGPLLAAMHARCDEKGLIHLVEAEALVCCTVLAAGIAKDSPGGVVLRSGTDTGQPSPDRPDEVRGWTLRAGWLRPLTEAQVFNAYCTDAESGDPVPPEPGVVHRPGFDLPPPEDG